MDIDIIKNRRRNCIGFISFLFVLLSVTSHAQDTDCQIYKKELSICADDYPMFSDIIESFNLDSSSYDYLSLKIIGGSPNASSAKRVYMRESDNKWVVTHVQNGNSCSKTIDEKTENLTSLFNNVVSGEYIALCSYSTLNDTHVYMTKKKGESIFKLVSVPYSALKYKDDGIISSFVNLYSTIEESD